MSLVVKGAGTLHLVGFYDPDEADLPYEADDDEEEEEDE